MSTGEIDAKFKKMEVDDKAAAQRKKAASADALRIKQWKEKWGYVDDSLVGTAPPKTVVDSVKGSRDDTRLPSRTKDEFRDLARKRDKALPEKAQEIREGLARTGNEFERKKAVLRGRYAAERTAAIDQITGTFYSEYRKGTLEDITRGSGDDPFYLASEYGMRTAKDEAAEHKSGIRISHDKSSIYLRDAPGKAKGLFEELYKSKHEGALLPVNGFIVNSPKVVEKLTTFYGAELFLSKKCDNEGCGKRGTAYAANTGACPACQGAVIDNPPRMETLASGICALVCDFNPEKASEYFEQPDARASMQMLLQSVGATPSSYQAFKALHEEGGRVPLAEKSLGNERALKNLATSPGVTTLGSLPATHPMANISGSALAMIAGLKKLPLGETDKIRDYPEDAGEKYAARRKSMAPKVRMALETKGIDALEKPLAAVEECWAAAEQRASDEPADFAGANEQLDVAEEFLNEVLQGRFERDPMVQDSLQNLERIVTALPNYKDDPARFTGLYDLMIDELYVILARSCPYQEDDFKDAVLESLGRRAPVIDALDAKKETYLLSSGMDAISTGFVAAMKSQGGSKPEVMDFDVDNANYFEVKEVLKHAEAVQEHGQVLVATLNPSTPLESNVPKEGATPVTAVDKILGRVSEKISGLTEGERITLVLDATIETKAGGEGTESELNRLLTGLQEAINEGQLNLVLCKSYQKYPSLGTGKVMAGNVTVISKDENFAEGTKFIEDAERELDFAHNDESQLMTHMLSEAADYELHMMERAGKNATFLEQRCGGKDGWGTYNEGLPFLLTTNKKVLDVLVKMGVERRDSFGFQNSSCLDIPQGIRINPGQESEQVLTEKFYAVGHFMANRDEKSPAAFKEVGEHMTTLKDNNAAASCLAFASAALELTAEEQTALLQRYDEFIKTGMDGVSDPMKTQLLHNYVNELGTKLMPPPKVEFADIAEEPAREVKQQVDQLPHPSDTDLAGLQKAVRALPAAVSDLEAAVFAPAKALAEQLKKTQGFLETAAGWVKRNEGWTFDRQRFGKLAEARDQLFEEFAKAKQRVGDLSATRRRLEAMTAAADKFPHKEDRAKLLTNDLSADTFSTLPGEARSRLTERLYNGLDVRSKVAVFEQLVDDGDIFKAEACLGNLEKTIEDVAVFGKGDVMDVQTLSSGSTPGKLTDEEQNALLEMLRILKQKLETQKALWQAAQEWKWRQDFDRAKDLKGQFGIIDTLLGKPDLAKAAMFLKKLAGPVAALKDSDRVLKAEYEELVNKLRSLQQQEEIKKLMPTLDVLLQKVGELKSQVLPSDPKGQEALEQVVTAYKTFARELGDGELDAELLDAGSHINTILVALNACRGEHAEKCSKYVRGLVDVRVNELLLRRQSEVKEQQAQSDPVGWLKALQADKFWEPTLNPKVEAIRSADESERGAKIEALREEINRIKMSMKRNALLKHFPG